MNTFTPKLTLAAATVLLWSQPVLAVTDPGSKEQACVGATGNPNCGNAGFFSGFVGDIVNTLIFIVGGIAVIMLVVGGIRYTLSGGDPNSVKGAKDTIIYALIGIVVAAVARLLVQFVIGRI